MSLGGCADREVLSGAGAGEGGGTDECAHGCLEPRPDLPIPTCADDSVALSSSAGELLLVLDASGSMVNPDQSWDHDRNGATAEVTRWRSLHDEVVRLVGTFGDTLQMGVVLFPGTGEGHDCDVSPHPEVPVMPNAGQAILDALPPRNEFAQLWENPTPMTSGLQVAIDHMLTLNDPVSPALMLISDGEPSDDCLGGFAQSEALVSDAFMTYGIPTFVVGIKIGQSSYQEYDRLAEAGGVPAEGNEAYYRVENAFELELALQRAVARVTSCTLSLPRAPDDPALLQVRIEGDLILPTESCSGGPGWRWSSPQGPYDQIVLCGGACERLRDAGDRVAVHYGCPGAG